MNALDYRSMSIADLGDNCNEADLLNFREACRVRQEQSGESPEAVSHWMWNNGDWDSRVQQYVK